MRIPGRAVLTACALALTVGCLAGCTPSHAHADPVKTPKPQPTPTPVFTSDAEALAAATETYKKYLGVIDAIGHDGGKDPDRLAPYVNAEGLQHERGEAKRLVDAGAHQTGDTGVTATQLQQRSSTQVTIYACQDGSSVDILDATGASLVDPSRPDLIPYVVTLAAGSDGSLAVTADKFWEGGSICG